MLTWVNVKKPRPNLYHHSRPGCSWITSFICFFFNTPQVGMFVSPFTELWKDILILFTSPITCTYPLSDTHESPKQYVHERQNQSNQKYLRLRWQWRRLDSDSITSWGLCILSSTQLLKAKSKDWVINDFSFHMHIKNSQYVLWK